jgi:hypothetical protein
MKSLVSVLNARIKARLETEHPTLPFFAQGILPYFTQTGEITLLGVFSDAFPGKTRTE